MVRFCQRISRCNQYKVPISLNSSFFQNISLDRRWSELYFIVWYLVITTIGLNICLALSGDVSIVERILNECNMGERFQIYDAKKKRADEKEELIVSNMHDVYRFVCHELL